MNYLKKPATEFNHSDSGTRHINNYYSKPATCPHCGIGVDAPFVRKCVFETEAGALLMAATCKCTSCQRYFFFTCLHDGKSAPSVCIWPNSDSPYSNDNLSAISPRFIDIYNQALRSESRGDIDIAAIGYRTALEILVKDYAINELGLDADEVSKQSLCNAIGEYLKQEDLVKTADVVRIFGNDYVHYKEKYPDKDFHILKSYMIIFMRLVDTEYMIKHPPVSR